MNLREYHYDNSDLGAKLNQDGSVTFKVWAPNVSSIALNLYEANDSEKLITTYKMVESDTIWELTAAPIESCCTTLDGYYYDFTVTHQDGTIKNALDPYALSMAGFSPINGNTDMGKGAIVAMDSDQAGTKPLSMGISHLATPTDMIAYEVHVRDFTIGTDTQHPGTFLGFAGYTQGIEHLKELGITHVQFLPVQNYFTVDEGNKEYQEVGSAYNWGYDPHNYFTLEGWLASDEEDPYSRIREFRTLVNTLHENGIGVIMDVVYNHTYGHEIFENLTPGSYYRMFDGHISGATGAGPTLESRNPMVQKLIIDSLLFFVEEYGIDGFRFDLMGFMDIDTMIAIRAALGENIVLQGEAWNFTDLPITEAPVKGHSANYPHDCNIALFNDSTRDSYVGKTPRGGFALGVYDHTDVCRAGIIGNIINYSNKAITIDGYHRFAYSPNETLQYLSIHDGFTLWDKVNLSFHGDMKKRARIVRMSLAMLFTSQGKIIIQGGTEIGLTKPFGDKQRPHDPEPNRTHTSEAVTVDDDMDDITHFHENSYSSSDFINKIRWERKEQPLFKNLNAYVSGLIALRRANPALRLSSSENIKKGLEFFLVDDFNAYRVIAYTLDNTIENYYGMGVEPTNYSKLVVVHNASFELLELKSEEFSKDLEVLVDADHAGTTPIDLTDIVVEDGSLFITANTTVVLGLRK